MRKRDTDKSVSLRLKNTIGCLTSVSTCGPSSKTRERAHTCARPARTEAATSFTMYYTAISAVPCMILIVAVDTKKIRMNKYPNRRHPGSFIPFFFSCFVLFLSFFLSFFCLFFFNTYSFFLPLFCLFFFFVFSVFFRLKLSFFCLYFLSFFVVGGLHRCGRL